MLGSFWYLATAIAAVMLLKYYDKIPVLSAWVWAVVVWLCFNVLVGFLFFGAFAKQRAEDDV